MIRFKERSMDEELMDDLQLDQGTITAVLEDINRVNKVLGGNRITLKAVDRLIGKFPKKEYSILDVGCGDGSMLRQVALHTKRKGIKTNLVGIDFNGKSIALARQKNSDIENITFIKGDLFELMEEAQYDLLLCTLTLHHFRDEDIERFIRKFSKLARLGVIVNDLDRNRIAWTLFNLYSFLFMKTGIAKKDGLISIKSGFTKKELLAYATKLPGMEHQVSWRWAFRYEWTFWHPNQITL